MRRDRARPRPRPAAEQTLPIPFAALDGFPAGRSPPRADAPRELLQWGVAGFASVYGAKQLGFEQVWEAVAAAEGLDRQLPRAALPGGRQRRAERRAARPAAPTTPPTPRPRPAIGRLQGDSSAKVGSRILEPGLAGRFREHDRRRPGSAAATPRPKYGFAAGSDAYGFDTLYNAGKLAVMPAVDAHQVHAQPLRQLGHLVRGQLRPQHQDRLARALDRQIRQRRTTRCRRSRSTPRSRSRSAR